MVAVGRDPFDVREQKITEPFHLGQPLPAQGGDPGEQEIQDPGPRLVASEPVELLAQHVGFKQAAVHGK